MGDTTIYMARLLREKGYVAQTNDKFQMAFFGFSRK